MTRLLTRRERRELARQQKRLMPSEPLKSSSWNWLVPCLAALLVYARTLSFSFIHDDVAEISPITTLWHEISQPVHHSDKYYRPVFSAWMFFVHGFAGLEPSIWHFASVALHVLATLIVFRLVFELLDHAFAAGCAAFLFAIHPAHIEAVSWVLANNEMLYTIFFLSSLLLLSRSLRESRKSYLWLSLGAWMAALFTKETAVALFPVFFWLAFFEMKATSDWMVRLKCGFFVTLPYAVTTTGYLAARACVLHVGMIGSAGTIAGRPWPTVLFSSAQVGADYIRKLLWPAGLSPTYDTHLLSTGTFQMWLILGFAVCSLCALAWTAKRYPLVGIGASIIVLPLLPVLYGMRFFANRELVQDRYLYLPSVGLCLIFGLIVKHVSAAPPEKRTVFTAAGIAYGACFLWLLFAQQGYYASSLRIDQRVLELQPDSVGVLDALGRAYLAEGRPDLALPEFARAYQLAPFNIETRSGLGESLYHEGRYWEARQFLEELARSSLWMNESQNPDILEQHLILLNQLQDIYERTGDAEAARRISQSVQSFNREISRNHLAHRLFAGGQE